MGKAKADLKSVIQSLYKMKRLLLLFSFLIIFSTSTLAQTSVSDTLSANTTWTVANSPYTVTDDLTIASGATLTIDAGVTVQFDAGTSMYVDGALVADGDSGSEITFTSSSVSKAAGDWGTIRFNNTSNVGSVLDYVIIEYGGGASTGALITYKTGAFGVNLTNSELRFSSGHGIDLRASSPVIEATTLRDNSGYGVYSDLALNFEVQSSTIIRNTGGGVRVPINATPVIYDSQIDTNGVGIYLDNGSSPEITFNQIRANTTGIRVIEVGSPVIEDNEISGNSSYGLNNEGVGEVTAEYNYWGDKSGPQVATNPTGAGDKITMNIDYTPWSFGATLPVKEITAMTGNSVTWHADTVYVVKNSMSVGSAQSLTVEPGTIVKFETGVEFNVYGTLNATGTAGDLIYFTSVKDDAAGGDSNGDARNTQPAKGDWSRIYIRDTGSLTMEYSVVRYAGYNNWYAALYVDGLNPVINHNFVSNNLNRGIQLLKQPTSLTGNVTNYNGTDGLVLSGVEAVIEDHTSQYNSSLGIYLERNGETNRPVVIKDSDISYNNHGIYVRDYAYATDQGMYVDSLINSVINGNNENGLYVTEGNPNESFIYNNEFSDNGTSGISIWSSASTTTIKGNTFTGNGKYGILSTRANIYDNSFTENLTGIAQWGRLEFSYAEPGFSDLNTFTDNTYNNALGLVGRELRDTLSISFPTSITTGVYMFEDGGETVVAGDTLVIDAGVIIKSGAFGSYSYTQRFNVGDGMLVASGTAEAPVVFTSYRDHTYGGKTNAASDTTSAAPGDWYHLSLADGSNDNITKNSVLEHVVIRYGYYENLYLALDGGTLLNDLDHLTLEYSMQEGLRANSTGFTLLNSEVKYNAVSGNYCAIVNENYYGNTPIGSIIRNTTVSDNNYIGICGNNYAGGSYTSNFYQNISNSTISNNGHIGIYIQNLENAMTVLGNTVSGNGNDGINIYSKDVDETDLFYTGNTVTDNGRYGILSSSASFIDNTFEGNQVGISMWGKLGNRYVDENGFDGNTFTDNTYNNVLGLVGRNLSDTLSITFPDEITSSVYQFLDEGTTVAAGDTLVIDPGVTIKLGAMTNYSYNQQFNVADGMLVASGSAEFPIVFTSYRDHDYGGKTNALDDTTSAAPGDWYHLALTDAGNDNITKNSVLEHVVIRYGYYENLYLALDSGSFLNDFDNLTIQYANQEGIRAASAGFTLTNSLVEENATGGNYCAINHQNYYSNTPVAATIRNSVIRNNNYIGVCGTNYAGGSYVSNHFREISNSVIENNGNSGIYITNVGSPMTFQQNTITGNVYHGIDATVRNAATDTVLTISGNKISMNGYSGIKSSRAIIVDDTLTGNGWPIEVTGELSKAGTVNDRGNFYSGNVIYDNEFDSLTAVSGTIKGWLGGTKPAGFNENLWLVNSTITLDAADSLFINKGTVFKSKYGVSFNLNGYFEALGSVDEKIVFTSFQDDTYAGNTNNDTTGVQPGMTNWEGLRISGAAADSSYMKNVISRYARYAAQINSDMRVDSSFFSYSEQGVRISTDAYPAIRYSDFHSNNSGMHLWYGANPTIQFSNFYNNNHYSIFQSAGTDVVAINNYWGDPTGPFVNQGSDQNLQGLGDRIYISSGTVSYRPFLTGRNGILLGDVTENGGISAFDASKILLHVVGSELLSGTALAAGDVSGNGSVSAMDASYVLQYVVGMISGFPGQGKQIGVDFTQALALNIGKESGAMEMELQNNGLTALYGTEFDIVLPGHTVNKVELVNSPFEDNLTMISRIEGDTIRIAIASDSPLTEKGLIGAIRFSEESPSEHTLGDNVSFDRFVVNEAEITTQFNEVYATSVEDESAVPSEFALNQNYPNPFNPTTNISYDLPVNGDVQVSVYNMLGQLVHTLVQERQKAGRYTMQWDASRYSSGTYLLRIEVHGDDGEGFSRVRKMMLIK